MNQLRFRLVMVVAGALLAVGYFLLVSSTYPQAQVWQISKPVFETRTRDVTIQVPYIENGQTKFRAEQQTVPYIVAKMVSEERTLPVSGIQRLQWWFLAIVIFVFAALSALFVGLWMLDKLRGLPSGPHTRENKRNLAVLVAFIFGAAGSLLGALLDSSPDVERLQMQSDIEALRATVERLVLQQAPGGLPASAPEPDFTPNPPTSPDPLPAQPQQF